MSSYRLEGNEFVLFGRSTGMGAYTDAVVYDATGEVINPVRESRSRTGNHWTKKWKLPGSFMIVYYDRTNSGNDVLEVMKEKNLFRWRNQSWYRGLSAEKIKSIYSNYLSEVDE